MPLSDDAPAVMTMNSRSGRSKLGLTSEECTTPTASTKLLRKGPAPKTKYSYIDDGIIKSVNENK